MDISFSLIALIIMFPIYFIFFIVLFFESGSPIFKQQRVGKNKVPFVLYKFRTMSIGTDSVATHLVDSSAVTRMGAFLRRTKLDELPQLWNVLKGDMSFVGPRPCLFNQTNLIEERSSRSVFDVSPGITGLSQLKHIDMSTPKLLAETDAVMIKVFTVRKYFYYIWLTLLGKGAGDRIRVK